VRVIAATNRRLEEAVATGLFREDLFFRLNVVCITLPPLRDRREEIPLLVRHFLVKYSRHYRRPETEIPQATLDAFMEHAWPGNVRELENVVQRMILLGPEFQRWTPGPEMQRAPVAHHPGDRRFAASERRQSSRGSDLPGRLSVVPTAPPQPVAAPHTQVVAAPVAAPAPSAPATLASGSEQASLKLVGRNAARAAERELMLRMLNRTRWNRKEAAEILGISYKALLYKIKEHRLDDPLTDLEPPGRA
jgi:two-component system response regulator AtoC